MSGTITHKWNGTVLTITSDSGTSACDLKGEKGDTGIRGAQGVAGKALVGFFTVLEDGAGNVSLDLTGGYIKVENDSAGNVAIGLI